MKSIEAAEITKVVADLCIRANTSLNQDVVCAFEMALAREESPVGRAIIEELIENNRIATDREQSVCQDTGLAVVFVDIGQDVRIVGGSLTDAVNAGVGDGYTRGFLRASSVSDPLFDRRNTNDNTPAIIHTELVAGSALHITVAPKGGGGENMGALCMLKPADGVEGVKRFVVDTARIAGANACPPFAIVGVGIGGTMEKSAILAKRALIRKLGEPNSEPRYAQLEADILGEINATGIGPGGLGGTVTALAVHVEWAPTHIASLPVTVNIQCNAARHCSATL